MVDNSALHATEDRFYHVEELRGCRQGDQVDDWPFTRASSGCVEDVEPFDKDCGSVPGCGVPLPSSGRQARP